MRIYIAQQIAHHEVLGILESVSSFSHRAFDAEPLLCRLSALLSTTVSLITAACSLKVWVKQHGATRTELAALTLACAAPIWKKARINPRSGAASGNHHPRLAKYFVFWASKALIWFGA